MFRLTLLAGLLSISNSQASMAAQHCTTVDHRDRLPPIRNQIGFSWCYAFVTADLLSFETGKAVSAIGTGIQDKRYYLESYAQRNGFIQGIQERLRHRSVENKYDFDMGGSVYGALQANLRHGPLCMEKDLPQEYQVLYQSQSGSRAELASRHEFDRVRNAIQNYNPAERGILDPGDPHCNRMDSAARMILPSVDTDDFRALSLALEKSADPLPQLYDQACKNGINPPTDLEPFIFARSGDGTNLVQALDAQLERAPASIGYSNADLTGPTPFSEVKKGNHVSVVAMRRLNPDTGQCEYLVRNSGGPNWGKDCHSSLRCQDGSFWVTRDMVKKMSQVVGLKRTSAP